ncbi:hypothetical protein [Pleomorphomonas sp. JP5]|uniref:hypothetical protein n=1 Tax=Pleomorphomonas sp. JP5 TaxID=2942998 RepID=UPI002042F0C8|nr:hypothetical protein [Pleomorphomonas sp. JP5]MCM5559308.1 hypothetical protein [Pleomorphomonas sp. JP5]
MSRNDSYRGGSTIIGPWSIDWFGRPKKKQPGSQQADAEKPVRKQKTKAEKARAKQERAKAKQAKAAKRAKLQKVREKERKQLERQPQPTIRKNPDEVARRMNKAMEGVTVLRKDKRGVPRPVEQAVSPNRPEL